MLKAPTYHLGEGYYIDSEPDLSSEECDFETILEEPRKEKTIYKELNVYDFNNLVAEAIISVTANLELDFEFLTLFEEVARKAEDNFENFN